MLMSMTGNMKIWIAVVATIWWVAIVGPARVCSFPTLHFTTEGATQGSYSKFIAALRTELASGKESYRMPLLRQTSTVTDANRFVLVTLSNLESVSITLAIDVINVYIIAYETSGKQSYFFSDAPKPASSKLFPEATKREVFPFSSSYIDLQRVGKVESREEIDLGISELDRAISSIDRTASEKELKTVARSIIVSIQMISEAARFAYIEQVVVKSITATEYKKFKPDPAVLSLENKWEDLSKAVQNSANGDFSTPIELQRPDGSKFKVTGVSDSLRGNLKLLLATKNKAAGFISSLVKSIKDNYIDVPLTESIFK